ncbi:MAG TPA: hypothetical protein VF456_25455 [Vicinamibacterales bacterium]
MFRLVLILIGVIVAMIVNRDVRGDRRRGPIVLAGTIGGLFLGVAVAYLLSPSTFRFEGLDVLDICLFAGVIGGILASWIIGSSLTRRGTHS